MQLMMDVIQYVVLTGIRPTLEAFAAAADDMMRTYASKVFEWRVGPPVLRDLLRFEEEYGRSAVYIAGDGRMELLGTPIKQLPESYPSDTVLAILNTETHAVRERSDD